MIKEIISSVGRILWQGRGPFCLIGAVAALWFFAGIATATLAPDAEPNTPDVTSLSLEELMNIPVVTSSSRQEQKVNQISVPISVVTAEDIHYGGFTNIYEALFFVPGMDVLQNNRNTYSAGVHGLHDLSSDRTLSLINGRKADSPAWGGSEFLRQPVLMEDIERIEVIRGPGGAAWGANAFNGVINVITKKPEDVKGWLLSTDWNHFGDNYHQARWADHHKNTSWRMSTGYENQETSSDALANETFISTDPLNPMKFTSRDFRRTMVVDTDVLHRFNEDVNLRFGAGHSHMKIGDYEFGGFWPRRDGFSETTRAYTQLNQTYSDTSKGYLQWTGNFANTYMPSIARFRSYQNDLEGQVDFKGERHNTLVGGNLAQTCIDQTVTDPQQIITPDSTPKDRSAGAFVIDHWDITDRFTLENQLRGDWNSGTGPDWAGRISGLYGLDEQKHHIFRVSGAKAFRTPLLSPRTITTERYYIPGIGYMMHLAPMPDMENEELWSLETGLNSILSKHWRMELSAYLQKYDELIGYYQSRFGPFNMGRNFLAGNLGDAMGAGSEIQLTYHDDHANITGWYSLNDFHTEGASAGATPHQDVRSFLPAKHKAGLNTRWTLPHQWTLSLNYKFSAETNGQHHATLNNAAEFHRMDLNVAKAFEVGKTQVEFMAGISDIFNETEEAISGMGDSFFNGFETPGRTLFGRLQLHF